MIPICMLLVLLVLIRQSDECEATGVGGGLACWLVGVAGSLAQGVGALCDELCSRQDGDLRDEQSTILRAEGLALGCEQGLSATAFGPHADVDLDLCPRWEIPWDADALSVLDVFLGFPLVGGVGPSDGDVVRVEEVLGTSHIDVEEEVPRARDAAQGLEHVSDVDGAAAPDPWGAQVVSDEADVVAEVDATAVLDVGLLFGDGLLDALFGGLLVDAVDLLAPHQHLALCGFEALGWEGWLAGEAFSFVRVFLEVIKLHGTAPIVVDVLVFSMAHAEALLFVPAAKKELALR